MGRRQIPPMRIGENNMGSIVGPAPQWDGENWLSLTFHKQKIKLSFLKKIFIVLLFGFKYLEKVLERIDYINRAFTTPNQDIDTRKEICNKCGKVKEGFPDWIGEGHCCCAQKNLYHKYQDIIDTVKFMDENQTNFFYGDIKKTKLYQTNEDLKNECKYLNENEIPDPPTKRKTYYYVDTDSQKDMRKAIWKEM